MAERINPRSCDYCAPVRYVSLNAELSRKAISRQRAYAEYGERLALTASAVSGHVKPLEQSAGTRLISRTTRRLHPT